MTRELDIKQLGAFSPLSRLKRNTLHEVLKEASLSQAKLGETLFKEGDPKKRTIYVLSGTVELRKGDEVVETIIAGSDAARNPISPVAPREHTAVAAGVVEIVTLDTELLDSILTWGQTGSYEVGE